MNRRIATIYAAAENRYLTKAEQQALLGYSGSLRDRLDAMRQVEEAEDRIIESLIQAVYKAYPNYQSTYADADYKGRRDMSLVLRYAGLAMVRDDLDWLDETVLLWARTMLVGVGFTPEFLRNVYGMMKRAVEAEVSEPAYRLWEPALQRVIDTLSAEDDPRVGTAPPEVFDPRPPSAPPANSGEA